MSTADMTRRLMAIVWFDKPNPEPHGFKITIGFNLVGAIRRLPNGKWHWHCLDRAARKQHESWRDAVVAVHRACGSVQIEEILS